MLKLSCRVLLLEIGHEKYAGYLAEACMCLLDAGGGDDDYGGGCGGDDAYDAITYVLSLVPFHDAYSAT